MDVLGLRIDRTWLPLPTPEPVHSNRGRSTVSIAAHRVAHTHIINARGVANEVD